MHFEFRLPDVGEGITEAAVLAWHVSPGQPVSEDDRLLDIETDKAIVEIPAPCTGQLMEQRAAAGTVAKVGDVIAVLETSHPPRQQFAGERHPTPSSKPDGDGLASRPAYNEIVEVGEANVQAATAPHATPSTRAYARATGVDLANVAASGPQGRILKSDVDVHILASSAPSTQSASAERVAERRVPLSGIPRAMFDAMTRAALVPQATTGFSARAAGIEGLRARLSEKTGIRISYLALVIKAVLPALRKFPQFNASLDAAQATVIEKRYYHIGFAVHTEAGLMVPVIRDAPSLDLLGLNEKIARLVALARERKLAPNEATGATFTLTNWGSHAEQDTFATPIVNPPQVAILGMGRIRDEIVPVGGQPAVERRMPLVLSYDHRLIDGISASTFMSHVLAAVEDPDILLARL